MSIFIISKYYSRVIHGLHLLLIRAKRERRERKKERRGGVGNNKAGECPIIMASKLGYVLESVTFA